METVPGPTRYGKMGSIFIYYTFLAVVLTSTPFVEQDYLLNLLSVVCTLTTTPFGVVGLTPTSQYVLTTTHNPIFGLTTTVQLLYVLRNHA